jgi:tRNA(fMet)-specific endonuclease VapC
MATLIDSSVPFAAERGQLEFGNIGARFAEEDVAISAVTASELLHGVHRARSVAQRHRRQAFVEGLMAQLPVIAFDLGGSSPRLTLGRFGQVRRCHGRT